MNDRLNPEQSRRCGKEDLSRLLSALCDENITSAEMAVLDDLLVHDAQCRAYREIIGLHVALQFNFDAPEEPSRPAIVAELAPADIPVRQVRSREYRATVLDRRGRALAGGTARGGNRSLRTRCPSRKEPFRHPGRRQSGRGRARRRVGAREAIAELQFGDDCRWADDCREFRPGLELRPAGESICSPEWPRSIARTASASFWKGQPG